MIERVTIDGRQATAAYVDKDFEPAARADATMVKVVFDDGEVRFGYRTGDVPAATTEVKGESDG